MSEKRKFQLEVLTAVHVGSGQQIGPADYVLDRSAGRVVMVDHQTLFQDRRFALEEYVELVRKPGFSLARNFQELALAHPRYTLAAGDQLGEFASPAGQARGNILAHIKEGGRPYIPGSSLKGAIRSMLLRRLLQHQNLRQKYEEQIEIALNDAVPGSRQNRKEFFSLAAEKRLLGQTGQSVGKAVQISDTSWLEPDRMKLVCVKVLSLTRQGYGWKDLAGRQNVTEPRQATAIFCEALPRGTVITGALKIDPDCPGLPRAWREILPRLGQICRQGAVQLLEREREFFARLDLSPCQQAVEELLERARSCKDNQMLIPLAWGTGYLAKAAGGQIDPALFSRVRTKFNMGRRDWEFPKTRKVLFENGRPAGLPGWVLITLDV